MIGFHPEGKRNLNEDHIHFARSARDRKGHLQARPQVIPVFIAGLGNDFRSRSWEIGRGGEKVRIWFGEPIDLSEFYLRGDRIRTHKEIADHLMTKIARTGGERSRTIFFKYKSLIPLT